MKKYIDPGLSFPTIPTRWGHEERNFALGLRNLFEQVRWVRAYPPGIVVFSAKTNEQNQPVKPFSFGEWEQVQTGISGVYGWRRTK